MLGKPTRALLALALLVAPLLGACDGGGGGGGDDDRERVDAVAQEALGAVDGVVHEIADGVQMTFNEGNAFDAVCGDDLAPGGVIHHVTLNFDFQSSDLLTEQAVDRAAEILAADGWTVDRPEAPQVVVGTKGVQTMRLEFGSFVVVQITSDCVETSRKVAKEYAEAAESPIVWK